MSHCIHKSRFSAGERRDKGYILLVLLLFVTVLSIGFLALVRKIDFEVKRDREQEMIHRGVQYSRAVKRYFKKFGRYPTRIEDLESTNNIRFLRKRYKDPITGKDFKLLHITDMPQMAATNANLSNAVATGLNSMQSSFGAGGGGSFGTGGSFGRGSSTGFSTQSSGGPGAFGGMTTASGGRGGFGGMATASGGSGGFGGMTTASGAPGALSGMTTAPSGPGPSAIMGSNNSQFGGPGDASAQNQSNPSGGAPSAQPLAQHLGPTGAPQVFGGGAIIGVASVSKDKTIREFNKKDHYDQWQFIYDPTSDRGGLLMSPYQPSLQGAVPVNQMQSQPNNGQSGFPAAPNQGFGVNQPTQPPSSQPPAQQ